MQPARSLPIGREVPETVPIDRVWGLPEPLFYLLVGVVTAPLFALTPITRLAGWFFAALCHEIGHSVVGWLWGRPSFPAINPTGHGISISGEQEPLLVGLLAVALCLTARLTEERGKQIAIAVAALVVYPLLALGWSFGTEVAILLAGHGGELGFAAVFLWRAACGGFTQSDVERGLFSTVGWFLVGSNLWLTVGLMTSAARRAWYSSSGSFGGTNDYIRVGDMLGWSVGAVACLMTLAALAAASASVWWGWRRATAA